MRRRFSMNVKSKGLRAFRPGSASFELCQKEVLRESPDEYQEEQPEREINYH
jgi:hypothetical protein